MIEGVSNFVIEGVPNTEEIKKKLKKIQDFFSGQGVPRNTLSCKWRRHCMIISLLMLQATSFSKF